MTDGILQITALIVEANLLCLSLSYHDFGSIVPASSKVLDLRKMSYMTQGRIQSLSSAKLLFRFASTLDYCKFIIYWLLDAVNKKKSIIINGITN